MESESHTSAVTLISSIHGAQRRAERGIEKKNLKAAVKNSVGVKQVMRIKDEKVVRWKFIFADVVYITEADKKTEVTSWVLPLPLDKILHSDDDQFQYDVAKKRIANDFTSTTSHSVFVVDCSGSMKNSDVVAHRCRLDSVRYSIATEFIAKRLDNPSYGITPFDVITIIEMRDSAEVVFYKEPMSWILYNKLVDRAKINKPRAHGNYLPALEKAHQALRDGDHEDLALSLYFLTDGRPSDISQGRGISQYDIIRKAEEIASQFKNRLNFGMVGYGNPHENMDVLERMAKSMSLKGCDGKFERSDLKKLNALSTSLAELSNTLTSTRTQLTEVKNSKQKEKDYVLTNFDKNILAPGDNWETKYLKRHRLVRYEYVRYEKRFRWEKKPLLNKSAVGISFNNSPFDKGAERLVYQLCEIGQSRLRVGENLVGKDSIYVKKFGHMPFYTQFCKTQKVSQNLAIKFNKVLKNSPVIGTKVPRITFLDCFLYTYYDDEGYDYNYLAEKELDYTRYTKWNNNKGYVYGQRKKNDTLKNEKKSDTTVKVKKEEPKKKRVMFANLDSEDEESDEELEQPKFSSTDKEVDILDEDVPQAFTHFTYTWTKRTKMVCDLQGVLDRKNHLFELTDPAIHYASGSGKKNVFGRTDNGQDGMLKFFETHKCNKLCEVIGISQKRFDFIDFDKPWKKNMNLEKTN